MAEVNYSNESNLSVVQTTGNSQIETWDVGTENDWSTKNQEYNFGGHYMLGVNTVEENGEEKKVESARNWDIHSKVTLVHSEKLGSFISIKAESDKFSGYEQRNNYDLGMRYIFIKSERNNLKLETGIRYTEEFNVDEDVDVLRDNKGRVFLDYTYHASKQSSYQLWTEYIPNFTRGEDYLITTGSAVNSSLNDIFSLKVSYKSIYDNVPAIEGNKKTDTHFSTAFVMKLE